MESSDKFIASQTLIENIRLSHQNPRQFFDVDALNELAESIKAHGILEPLVVRPVEDERGHGTIWELVAGERRLRAAQQIGFTHVPCSFSANGVAVSVTYGSENNTVENCAIEASTSYGIYVPDSDYNQFIDNRVKNGSASGFWAAQYANHTLISGGEYSYNQVNSLSRGIYFKYSNYVEIKGVVAEQNNKHGILLSTACNYCHIHNNTVWDNGQAGGTHTQDGIVIATNCDYNIINSNSVSNSPRSEIRIHSSDCDNNTVFDNVLSGTHDVAFYDRGTGTVAYDNTGGRK